MNIRTAKVGDIAAMHEIRVAVKENVLNNPALVTEADYIYFLTNHGKGWVCEIENVIRGFAIIDIDDNNIWALFVHPDFDKRGIGRALHDTMLKWFFGQNKQTIWLSTAPASRAEQFYTKAGWEPTGLTKSGEIRFEMSQMAWNNAENGRI